jgi:DNA-binding MurR/RpiR family transcriptional regulator
METEMNVFLLIKLKYNTFTKSQKRLADFILADSEFVLNHSITEVAGACHVGDATISRFCKNLRFKGYQDFKIGIVRALPGSESDEILGNLVTQEDTISVIAKRILSKSIEALNETQSLLNEADFQKAVDFMIHAEHIMFFGVGTSFSPALESCNKFMRIRANVSINSETQMQYVSAALLSKKDVAVIISYSGSTKEIVDIARIVKGNGVKIICITHFLKSPLTNYSDVSLISSSNEQFIHGYSFSMELTQIYLLDILYTEYFRQTYDESVKNKEITASTLLDKIY